MLLSFLVEAPSRRDLFKVFNKKNGGDSTKPLKDNDEPIEPAPSIGGGTRRDFIKKTAGAASAAAGNLPVVKLANTLMASKDLLSRFTDEQLMSTPEEQWVHKLSPERAARINKNHPEYASNEAVAKITKILSYGFLKSKGMDAKWAHKYSDIGTNASRNLKQIGQKFNLKQSDLIKSGDQYGCFNSADEWEKFHRFIMDNAKDYGIKLDMGNSLKSTASQDELKRFKDHDANREYLLSRREEIRRQLYKPYNDNDAVSRWENEGGAAFEQKLTKALMLII